MLFRLKKTLNLVHAPGRLELFNPLQMFLTCRLVFNLILSFFFLQALKSLQESSYLTKDYAKLLDAIETLFPISLRCKLESHYR